MALIQPAGRLDEAKVEKVTTWIRSKGFFVCSPPQVRKSFHYFSGTDEERMEEFCWAMEQPGIRAVISCRGGYGSNRMLHSVSRKRAESFQPKLVTGFSDLTYAHQWIQNQLGWLSFHSSLVGQISEEAVSAFLQQLLDLPSKASSEVWEEAEVLQSGQAKGRLVGGNLSLLRLKGPAALPQRPLVLAIEDVGEAHYALDRLIWTLIDGGYSDYVQGVLVGSLHECGKKDADQFPLELIKESLKRLCRGPILWNCRFGHGLEQQRILPLGAEVRVKDQKIDFDHALVDAPGDS